MTEKLDLLAIGKLYGYTPPEPEPLERIRGGKEKIRVHTLIDPQDPMGDERPWAISDKSGKLLRITVTKTFK